MPSTSTPTLVAVDILKQARLHLTPKENWVKEMWLDERKDGTPHWEACSMGAMLLAEFHVTQRGIDEDQEFEDTAHNFLNNDAEFAKASYALANAIVEQHPKRMSDYAYLEDNDQVLSAIIKFNDHDKTTHKNVLKAFDTAITELSK